MLWYSIGRRIFQITLGHKLVPDMHVQGNTDLLLPHCFNMFSETLNTVGVQLTSLQLSDLSVPYICTVLTNL